jgi:hypothetical protein
MKNKELAAKRLFVLVTGVRVTARVGCGERSEPHRTHAMRLAKQTMWFPRETRGHRILQTVIEMTRRTPVPPKN